MKFTQLAKSLQEEISPVYLIEGEEVYFRDHAVKSIRKACALAQPSLNDVRFEGDGLKGEKFISFRDALSLVIRRNAPCGVERGCRRCGNDGILLRFERRPYEERDGKTCAVTR